MPVFSWFAEERKTGRRKGGSGLLLSWNGKRRGGRWSSPYRQLAIKAPCVAVVTAASKASFEGWEGGGCLLRNWGTVCPTQAAALKHGCKNRPLCIGMQVKVYLQSFLFNGSIRSLRFLDFGCFPEFISQVLTKFNCSEWKSDRPISGEVHLWLTWVPTSTD